MMPIHIRNRSTDFKPPQDGWIHLSPLGLHPSEKGTQIVDDAAVDALISNSRGPLLIDADHESHDPEKRTEALGWIEELGKRADGLWGKVRWSSLGESAVMNGIYRFISPVWECVETASGYLRPMRLLDAGLTNQPNLRGLVPVTNRKETTPPNEAKKGKPMLEKILVALGLPPDASEEVLMAEIAKLKNPPKAEPEPEVEIENKCDEKEKEVMNRLVAVENRSSEVGEKIAALEAVIASLKSTPAPAPITGGAPVVVPTVAVRNRSQEINALVNDVRSNRRCSFADAWEVAKAQNPKLFAE